MKIESNVPLPNKFPFSQMKVGDSFLLPDHIKRTAASVSARRFGDKNQMKFTIRKTEEGFRCWRIE